MLKRTIKYSMQKRCKIPWQGYSASQLHEYFASRSKMDIWRCFRSKILTMNIYLNQFMSMLKRTIEYYMQKDREYHDRLLVHDNAMDISPLAVKWISVDAFAARNGR